MNNTYKKLRTEFSSLEDNLQILFNDRLINHHYSLKQSVNDSIKNIKDIIDYQECRKSEILEELRIHKTGYGVFKPVTLNFNEKITNSPPPRETLFEPDSGKIPIIIKTDVEYISGNTPPRLGNSLRAPGAPKKRRYLSRFF
jgi:hypothetical protein